MCEDRVGRGKEYAKQQADGVCAKVILSGYEREGEGGGGRDRREREKKAQELEGNEAFSEGGAHRRM